MPLPRHDDHPRPSAVGTIVYLILGPILWAVQLTVIYGGSTLLCVTGVPPGASTALVALTTAAAFIAGAGAMLFRATVARWFGVSPGAEGRSTLDALARLLDLLSLVAILWTGSAAVVLQACIVAR
jgi:hypothetical protein